MTRPRAARWLTSLAGQRALTPIRSRVAPPLDRLALSRYRTLARRGELARDPEAVERETVLAFTRVLEADRTRRRPSPNARRALVDSFHRLYYHSSKQTWESTYFRGTAVWKNPLDLWLYQEILCKVRPDVIIETGTKYGGSAYYLASMCDLLDHGEVITIDIQVQPDRPEHSRITYLTGSSTDPQVIERVDALLPPDATTLVFLDSDHRCDHVLDELRIWASRVSVGSYLVVEDTNINGHPAAEKWGPGPMEAVDIFLQGNDRFEVDESKHKFFLTFNPRGFLRRVS